VASPGTRVQDRTKLKDRSEHPACWSSQPQPKKKKRGGERKDSLNPIKISFEDLFQFALYLEEAPINPEKDSEGNPRNSKEHKTETSIPQKQGGKGKNHKKNGGKASILKGQGLPSCDFCGRKGQTKTACRVKQKAMASAKKDTKDRSAQWETDKAEKAQAFAAAASTSKQKIVLVMKMKMKMTRTKRLL
jgi:hypothetical protein